MPLDPHVFLDQAHAVDRQVERVAAVIPQDEKVVANPLDRQLLKPIVLADAVLVVHDQVALFELLQVQELGAGLGRGLGPAQVPDAENLLIAQHGQAFGRPHKAAGDAAEADERRTGLGIPLARQLIEGHDGRLEIVSRKGAGTTATIRLP